MHVFILWSYSHPHHHPINRLRRDVPCITRNVYCGNKEEPIELWKALQAQTLFLLASRIDVLRESRATGRAYHLVKPVLYKLFSNVVDYSARYRALEDVILDAESHDAIRTVPLVSSTPKSAMAIDAVTQLAGFVLNSGLRYGDDTSCISVGLEAWREFEKLRGDQTFLSFQKLKKVALDKLLGVEDPEMIRGGSVGDRAHTKDLSMKPISHMHPITPPQDVPQIQLSKSPSPFRLKGTSLDLETTSLASDSDIMKTVLSIVAAENETATFTDLGVDSLMALTILSNIERDTGIDVEAGFFLEHETVGEAKQALLARFGLQDEVLPRPVAVIEDSQQAPVQGQLMIPTSEPEQLSIALPQASPERTSKIIHLRGPSGLDTTKLFFLADETGLVLYYMMLPSLGRDLCEFGVESPFAREPQSADEGATIQQLAHACATAIRREQPRGPYMVAGVSAGAALALEVARILQVGGNMVDGLLLLNPGGRGCRRGRESVSYLAGKGKACPEGSRAHDAPSPTAISTAAARGTATHAYSHRAQARRSRGGENWKPFVPHLQLAIRTIDVKGDSFMKFQTLNVLGQMCREAIEACEE
ncbi:Uu.00g056220.m01.CDS01 [Anthostomella pinea]|uniref:Uu.00g056220.m01.CDS01 n=1 Tax=Anthostomella pinea TaxID=933095 RepID=A0AAI8YM11_9PEZI|nr:Uu.00g056220.m01.CDS01 [Anthostomella pinea]